MKAAGFISIFLVIFVVGQVGYAQHCPPIYESYLREISVKHDSGSLKFRLEYRKNGGQPKERYQAYLLAYLDKNAASVPSESPDDLIDKDVVLILHTQLIERNRQGGYELEVEINGDELAKKMIEHGQLTEEDRAAHGGWGIYNDRFRIAVFVPFLEDEKYSVLEGLPEDKHECNYASERALLFQQLPYSFSIHFGIVQAFRLDEGTHHIQINGDKPPKPQK